MASSSGQSIYEMGEEMKRYEKVLGDIKISPDSFWIIRIDGKKFSSFTSVFKKKGQFRDSAISDAMETTASDLLKEFNAATAYTQSDEITLVFAPKKYYYEKAIEKGEPVDVIEKMKKALETNVLPFNGKVQKIVSLAASYAAARFNHHLNFYINEDRGEYSQKHIDRIGKAYFDARIFELPTAELVWKCVMWRIKDAIRASKQCLGYAHFSPKQLHKLTCKQIIEKVLQEKGVDYYGFSICAREGTVVKIQLRKQKCFDMPNDKIIEIIRSGIVCMTTNDLKKHGIDFLLMKKIDPSFPMDYIEPPKE